MTFNKNIDISFSLTNDFSEPTYRSHEIVISKQPKFCINI